MGMSAGIRASIAFGAAIVILQVLEVTLGAAMDSMYLSFYNLTSTIPLSVGWQAQAQGTLDGWVWWYRLPLIIIIALGVWVVENYFIDYSGGKIQ